MSALQLTWYVLLGVLALGYAVLDGFDLGAGLWALWAGGDRRRMAVVNAIAPVWDGNEVWLLGAGGASFAAFPYVYAAVFSGLYPLMLVLFFALIFRAVAMGFIHHEPVGALRWVWHVVLAGASGVVLFALGMMVGNLMNGLSLNAKGDWTGSHWQMFSPLAILLGLLANSLMASHGALYLGLRVKGDLADWARGKASAAWGVSLALLLAVAAAAAAARTHLAANYDANPALLAIPAVALVAVVLTGFLNVWRLPRAAFAASVVSIVALLVTAFAAMFPRIVPAAVEANSLTIAASSSSQYTLGAMLIVAGIGVPIALGYTAFVYWLFRARVDHEEGTKETGY
jgi:cytochrome bd ubiquinol oxidase subunit II